MQLSAYYIVFYLKLRYYQNIMEENLISQDENIANVLNRIVSLCKQTGMSELASKCERILKNYEKARSLREH
jgi:hypothetical protein